jgi:peroxiredoxin
MGPEGPVDISTDEVFKGKAVVLFAVPGAFTRTCSAKHLPGFVRHARDFKARGVDTIACIATNDAWVMAAWGRAHEVGHDVLMLGDGNGDFTRAVGMEGDFRANGLGSRSRRYAMIVRDGVIKVLNVEKPGAFEVSSAEAMLAAL